MSDTLIGACLAFFGTALTLVAGIAYRHLDATLRQRIDIEVRKATSDIELRLKTNEARLRVAAEYRLKILDRMLVDVASCRAQLNTAANAIYLLMQEAEPLGVTERGTQLLEDARRAFASISRAGPFMPPELAASFMRPPLSPLMKDYRMLRTNILRLVAEGTKKREDQPVFDRSFVLVVIWKRCFPKVGS